MKIAIVTGVVPEYRRSFYEKLQASDNTTVTLFCLERIDGVNLPSIHGSLNLEVNLTPSYQLPPERLVAQILPLRRLIGDYDVVFVDGNPRYITMVLLGLLLGVFKRPVVLWTMAKSFRNNPLTEWVRLRWSRFFKHILVYTDAEVSYLKNRGFEENLIIGINNGLNQERIEEVSVGWPSSRLAGFMGEHNLLSRKVLLSCARLIKKNQFESFPAVLKEIVTKHPDVVWVIIGEGESKTAILDRVMDLDLEAHVVFLGAVYDEHRLAPWFKSATLLVHPSAIGLTLLHSFGYGLPVVTHSNRQEQGPEIAAFIDGETGLLFEQNNFHDMRNKILELIVDEGRLREMRRTCLSQARDKYNTTIMVKRFMGIARLANQRLPR
jgi:glycosyltransferase involved in cell wall biosynthesis